MLRALLTGFCVLLALPIASASAAPRSTKGAPVYFPHTRSYYELIEIGTGFSVRGAPDITWEKAQHWAAGKSYKGIRGRLAVVKDVETTNFLRDTFKPSQPTWIGMRYYCRLNRLIWTDGSEYSFTGYKNWAQEWGRSLVCQNSASTSEFGGVYFSPVGDGFRWKANGQSKEYGYLFVEYPVGDRDATKTPAAKSGSGKRDAAKPATAAPGEDDADQE
jgi:hypothetical protein